MPVATYDETAIADAVAHSFAAFLSYSIISPGLGEAAKDAVLGQAFGAHQKSNRTLD